MDVLSDQAVVAKTVLQISRLLCAHRLGALVKACPTNELGPRTDYRSICSNTGLNILSIYASTAFHCFNVQHIYQPDKSQDVSVKNKFCCCKAMDKGFLATSRI